MPKNKKSYRKFIKSEIEQDKPQQPEAPVKIGENNPGEHDYSDASKVQTVVSTQKSAGRSNIHRSSWPANQMTYEEAKKLYKSMDDKVQKEYNMYGFDICVEWPAGKPRMYGKDNSKVGKTSVADYGFFKGTKSEDGGGIDVYVGPNRGDDLRIFLLLQKPTSWDVEHGMVEPEVKWMLGFWNIDEATNCYKASMPEEYFLSIGEVTVNDFIQTIKIAINKKSPIISKSQAESEVWKATHRNIQANIVKYLEGENSASANQQTATTAEFSSEEQKIEKSLNRKKVIKSLIKPILKYEEPEDIQIVFKI